MPASNIDLYHMRDARNNFDAMRPAPVCVDANQYMGQCQNIHISTNCYYGYHDPKSAENNHDSTDCEMLEVPQTNDVASPQFNTRKRSAESDDYPQTKRFREDELQQQQNILWRLPTVTSKPQCDEVRLYFRGYGAVNFELQSLFTTSNTQEPRYISLSHEVQKRKNIEPETNEIKNGESNIEDLLESLYWNIHGGNIFQLLQCQ